MREGFDTHKTAVRIASVRKNSRAFTLVELLVVISIIALLLAVLMPALASARAQAKAIVCSSNVKQLALGMSIYESVNGIFPQGYETGKPNPPPGGWIAAGHEWWYWFHFAAEALGENLGKDPRSLYTCPARGKLNLPIVEGWGLENTLGNYAANQGITRGNSKIANSTEFTGTPLGLSHIKSPQSTLLLLDAGATHITWKQTTSGLASSYVGVQYYIPGLVDPEVDSGWDQVLRGIRTGLQNDAKEGRHPNKTVNAGFCDGHVQRMSVLDLAAHPDSQIADKRPWPLWRPSRTIIYR